MKLRHTFLLLFMSTTLLLIGTGGMISHPAIGQSTAPAYETSDRELGLTSFNTAVYDLEDKLRQWEQELLRDKQYQSTVDLKNFADEFRNLKPFADKNQNADIDKLAQNEVLIALSNMESIQSNNAEASDSIKILQKALKGSGEDLPETGIYAARTNSALLNALIKISKPQLSSDETLPPSVKESDATVPNLTDGNLNGLAIAAAIGSLLSLGTNLWLFLKIQKLQRFRASSGDSTSISNTEELLKKQVKIMKEDIKKLTDNQIDFEKRFRQQVQQRQIMEQPDLTPQSYGLREQPSSKYIQTPISPKQQSYDRLDALPESSQSSRVWNASAHMQTPAAMSPYAIIVQNYNANPSAIASSAEGVSETEESIYRRRRDSSITQVNLQKVSNYSYWIVVDAENNYWLVPKPDLKLNPMNFDTFQSLFNYQGQPSDSRLHLQKPARVTPQNTSGEWELIDRGDVDFV